MGTENGVVTVVFVRIQGRDRQQNACEEMVAAVTATAVHKPKSATWNHSSITFGGLVTLTCRLADLPTRLASE